LHDHRRAVSSSSPTAAAAVARRRKRQIVLVAPSFRFLGGVAVQADTLLRRWHSDPDVSAWLVPFDPLPPRPLRWLLKIKYLRTVVTQLTYFPLLIRQLAHADVVHVFSAAHTSFVLAALPAILVARLLRKPVVLNYHSGEGPNHLRRSRLARTVLAHVNSIVVQSEYLRDVFSTHRLDTVIVPNTIEFDRFRFKRRWHFAPRLLSTRNLEARYNVACTIRAFRIVKNHHPSATLTLVGFGREEAALRALVHSLKLGGVIFAGRVGVEEMSRYYDAADVFVQTPNVDNMPLSVLQAFAAGVPVVSTDAGGVPNILRHGQDGLLAPIGNHDAVAAQILKVLADQSLATRLSESAFKHSQQFAWHVVRQRWLDVYEGVSPLGRQAVRQRVIIFTTSFEPGGTERQTTELIRRLDRRRFEVHVACFHRRGAWLPLVESAAASIEEFSIRGFATPSTLGQLLAFVRWCRRLQPTALHCTGLYSNIFGLTGGAIAGVPLRIGSRREINPGRSVALLAAQRAAYALAHVVVANCHAAALQLRRERVPPERIVIVRNGIDAIRAEVRMPRPQITRIIVVANLRPEKGHDVLLAAVPALREKHPRLTITIVGDGPLGARLEQHCASHGLEHCVSFLGHREDVPKLLAESDLFVLPSRSESSSNAIIEAMAAGLPVVACAVGGNVELVQDGYTGRLVAPDDAPALTAAIDALVKHPDVATVMGTRARYLIRANHSYDAAIASYEALYCSHVDAPVNQGARGQQAA
jgi:glycosyltransferase involved in cell wall biosynthesis